MKKAIYCLFTFTLLFFMGCTKQMSERSPSGSSTAVAPTGSGTGTNTAGVITAGEWNDLDHQAFWDSLMQKTPYSTLPDYWQFNHKNRFSVLLTGSDGLPIADAAVQLKQNGITRFNAKTDNRGACELWLNLFQ